MLNRIFTFLKLIYHLTKGGISFSVALTTATGFIISSRTFNHQVLYPFFGVLLLAMAASLLNQLIEINADRLMPRTQKRPLVNGDISVNLAITISILLTLVGFSVLLTFNGLLPALLGLLNLFWYTAIYTPLKYKTAFASIPGGIVGAIPPLIGWVAGGGNLSHPTSIALAVFFFIGQIPHFWLIISKYSDEYKLAGIKSITEKFDELQLKRIIFSWVIATALSGGILAFFMILNHNISFYLIQLLSIALIIYFAVWIIKTSVNKSHKAFISINVYYLLTMLIVIVDIFWK